MANGIKIERQQPGELIYLNLPNRPGSGRDKVPPQPPGRVLARQEVNIGHSGIGIYWSPGVDDNWISYYEVRRDGQVVGKASIGDYYFDHAPGWDGRHEYAVRTVDGDGNVSAWTVAEPTAGEPLTFAALGGHFSRPNRDGWSAESTADGRKFAADDLGAARHEPFRRLRWHAESTGRSRRLLGKRRRRPRRPRLAAGLTDRSLLPYLDGLSSGTIRIVGRAMREYYHRSQGGELKIKILLGQKQVWPEKDWAIIPKDDLTGVAHDIAIHVAAGDAIRFVLDKGSLPEHDLLAWMPRIVYDETETPSPSQSVVRILCGSNSPYTDSNGNVWSEDRFFSGGTPMTTTAGIEAAQPTDKDQLLYQHGREGSDFTYSIPVEPGLYALRLKFAEPKYPWLFQRPINLDINGRRMMHNADICQAARGACKAYEKVFRYLVPDGEGKLTLHFTSGFGPLKESNQAMVQAIELLPEAKPSVRIDCGADKEFVDWNSVIWSADSGFDGGTAIRSDAAVSQASPTLFDQELYRTARTGRKLIYRISVPPGLYTVHLKFAELWLKKPGGRPMNIEINGRTIRQNWDPATAAGQVNMAADIRTENIAPDQERQDHDRRCGNRNQRRHSAGCRSRIVELRFTGETNMIITKRTFGAFRILGPLVLVVLAFFSPPVAAEDPSAEWTLEQARKCWKPMTRAVQHVGVPGYEFQTGVMWDGALLFGPLGFRELKVMQQEIAPLGNHYLHVSFGYGEPMRLVDRQGTNSPRSAAASKGAGFRFPASRRATAIWPGRRPCLPICWTGRPISGWMRRRMTRL